LGFCRGKVGSPRRGAASFPMTRSTIRQTIRAALVSSTLVSPFGLALYGQTVPGHFIDATQKLGIQFRQQASPTAKKYLLETMGPGVAVFDYDNDGRLDIFLANGTPIHDPTPKGAIPKKTGPKYWGPPVPSETRWDV
jgi:hypothetical protein